MNNIHLWYILFTHFTLTYESDPLNHSPYLTVCCCFPGMTETSGTPGELASPKSQQGIVVEDLECKVSLYTNFYVEGANRFFILFSSTETKNTILFCDTFLEKEKHSKRVLQTVSLGES